MLKKQVTSIATIIGEKAIFEGTFTTSDVARVDGEIRGNIHSDNHLIIGTGGKILGDVHAISVLVAGTVRGDLYVTDKIDVTSTGKIVGDITTKSLVIDENALFQGQCMMTSDRAVQEEKHNAENGTIDKVDKIDKADKMIDLSDKI